MARVRQMPLPRRIEKKHPEVITNAVWKEQYLNPEHGRRTVAMEIKKPLKQFNKSKKHEHKVHSEKEFKHWKQEAKKTKHKAERVEKHLPIVEVSRPPQETEFLPVIKISRRPKQELKCNAERFIPVPKDGRQFHLQSQERCEITGRRLRKRLALTQRTRNCD
jgi:hypothetical protein